MTGEDRLRLLSDASRMLAESALDYEATLDALAQVVVPRLADDLVVFVIDEDGKIHRVTEASVSETIARVLRELRENPPPFGANNSVVTAVRAGKTVFVDLVDEHALANLAGSAHHAAALRAVRPKTFITVPLFGRGQVIGAVTFGISVSNRRYTPDDVTLAEELGRRAGMAIENARLFREAVDARERAEVAEKRMAHLQATTASLARVMKPADAARTVLEQGLAMLGASAGAVYILRDDALYALYTMHREPVSRIPLTRDWPVVHAVRRRMPLYLVDREELLDQFPSVRDVLPHGLQAAAVLPLAVDGSITGAIALNFVTARSFGVEEKRFAESLASQAALSLDRALLIERDRARANRAAFLAEASALLAGALDRDRVLADLTRLVVPRFADSCSIELADAGGHHHVAAYSDAARGVEAEAARAQYRSAGDRPHGVRNVIRTGKAELYPRLADMLVRADQTEREIIERTGVHSVLIVPLVATTAPIGAITLAWTTTDETFTEADRDLFVDLGHRAALAIENARLYRELQQAVQVRDDFLSAAGHELKTPLAALLMHVESLARQLRRNVPPANLGERLDKASAAGRRLERLVEELLDVSRITAGRLALEPAPMQLDELVREVVERFTDAETTISIDATPVAGVWDRTRLDQVVSNLVANALKYGRRTPIEISVGIEGAHGVLRVVDHGIGIAQAEQQRIFERFERAVGTREFGGLGLGLWIARQIVEASAGTIEVTSAPGEGATFVVRLPR